MPQFPENWPSECPPSGASEASGAYFRLARANPPTPEDFKSHAERGLAPKASPCKREGLSLFQTQDEAIHQYQLFPKLGKFIFCGTLTAEHGKTQLTKGAMPTHTTWWPCEGVDRAAVFKFLMEA